MAKPCNHAQRFLLHVVEHEADLFQIRIPPFVSLLLLLIRYTAQTPCTGSLPFRLYPCSRVCYSWQLCCLVSEGLMEAGALVCNEAISTYAAERDYTRCKGSKSTAWFFKCRRCIHRASLPSITVDVPKLHAI